MVNVRSRHWKEQISLFVTAVTANLQPLSHRWSFSQWHRGECWEPPRRGSTTYTLHIRPDGNFVYKWKLQQQNIDFSVKKNTIQLRNHKENLKKEKKNPLNSKVFMDISLRMDPCSFVWRHGQSVVRSLLLVPAHVNAEKASESFNGSQPGRKWGTVGVNL